MDQSMHVQVPHQQACAVQDQHSPHRTRRWKLPCTAIAWIISLGVPIGDYKHLVPCLWLDTSEARRSSLMTRLWRTTLRHLTHSAHSRDPGGALPSEIHGRAQAGYPTAVHVTRGAVPVRRLSYICSGMFARRFIFTLLSSRTHRKICHDLLLFRPSTRQTHFFLRRSRSRT